MDSPHMDVRFVHCLVSQDKPRRREIPGRRWIVKEGGALSLTRRRSAAAMCLWHKSLTTGQAEHIFILRMAQCLAHWVGSCGYRHFCRGCPTTPYFCTAKSKQKLSTRDESLHQAPMLDILSRKEKTTNINGCLTAFSRGVLGSPEGVGQAIPSGCRRQPDTMFRRHK